MKTTFIPLLVTSILFLSWHARAQDNNRVQVPSTRISIIPPPCYKLISSSPVFVCEKTGVLLTIVEVPKPVHEVSSDYSDPLNLAAHSFEEISRPEEFTIDGARAIKFNLRKSSGLLDKKTLIYRVFVGGDSSGAFTAIISYSDTVEAKTVDPLVASIETIHWDRGTALSPMGQLGFSIDVKGEFKLQAIQSRFAIYTPDGKGQDGDDFKPLFVIRLMNGPHGEIAEDVRQKLMESLLSNVHSNVKVSEVVEYNKIVVDGIRGFETVSRGKWYPGSIPVVVYYTLLFHPVNFIQLIGLSANNVDPDRYIENFKETVRSFKRKTVSLEDQDSCARILDARNYEDARNCFEATLLQNPASLPARLGMAEALRLQGKNELAIQEYDKVIEHDKLNYQALLGRGRCFATMKKYSQALDDFNLVIELDVRNVSVLIERAAVRKEHQDFYEAATDYKSAIAMIPDSAALYVLLGGVQPPADAIETYSKALTLDKGNALAYEKRGMAYCYLRKWEKAINDLSIAIKTRPHEEAYEFRGKAYFSAGNMDASIADLNRVSPNANLLRTRAFAHGLSKHFDEAMKDFSQSVSIDSTEWMSYFLRGIVLFLKGNFRDAGKDFRTAAGLTPSAEVRSWIFFSEFMNYSPAVATKNLKQYVSASLDQFEDWNAIVHYLLDDLTEEQLIRGIKPVQETPVPKTDKERLAEATCDRYFAIGMKSYLTGLKIAANKYWKKCLETNQTSIVSYQVAHTFNEGDGKK